MKGESAGAVRAPSGRGLAFALAAEGLLDRRGKPLLSACRRETFPRARSGWAGLLSALRFVPLARRGVRAATGVSLAPSAKGKWAGRMHGTRRVTSRASLVFPDLGCFLGVERL